MQTGPRIKSNVWRTAGCRGIPAGSQQTCQKARPVFGRGPSSNLTLHVFPAASQPCASNSALGKHFNMHLSSSTPETVQTNTALEVLFARVVRVKLCN